MNTYCIKCKKLKPSFASIGHSICRCLSDVLSQEDLKINDIIKYTSVFDVEYIVKIEYIFVDNDRYHFALSNNEKMDFKQLKECNLIKL